MRWRRHVLTSSMTRRSRKSSGARVPFLRLSRAIAIHRGGIPYLTRKGWTSSKRRTPRRCGPKRPRFREYDSRATVVERQRRTGAGEPANLLSERFVTANGEPLDVEVVALPVNLEDGPATQLVVRNVTELRRAERENARLAAEAVQALAGHQFTQEALELAESAAGLGVWDWTLGTNELRWTKGLEPLHGMEPGTFRGTFEHFLEAVIEEDRPALQRSIDEAMSEDSGDAFEARMRVKHQTGLRWVLGKGRVFRADDGQHPQGVGIGLDVTDRTAIELALAERETLLRLVTGLLRRTSRISIRTNGTVRQRNLSNWFGVEPGAVLGQNARESWRRAYELCAASIGEPSMASRAKWRWTS